MAPHDCVDYTIRREHDLYSVASHHMAVVHGNRIQATHVMSAIGGRNGETKMKNDVAQLEQHIRDLADAFSIVLVFDANCKPEQAYSLDGSYLPEDVRKACLLKEDDKIVLCRPIMDETSYAVALHEIGHAVHPLGRVLKAVQSQLAKGSDTTHPRERHRIAGLSLDQEYAAWEWAHANALYWSSAMQQVENFAIGTYEKFRKEVR